MLDMAVMEKQFIIYLNTSVVTDSSQTPHQKGNYSWYWKTSQNLVRVNEVEDIEGEPTTTTLVN